MNDQLTCSKKFLFKSLIIVFYVFNVNKAHKMFIDTLTQHIFSNVVFCASKIVFLLDDFIMFQFLVPDMM